jgi:hypothetical protein
MNQRIATSGVLAAVILGVLLAGARSLWAGDEPSAEEGPAGVVAFSPYASALDGEGALVRTDAALSASADARYPGRVVIAFPRGSLPDRASLSFAEGASAVDPAAIQFLRFVPGTGNIPVPVAVTVDGSRILLQPLPPYALRDADGELRTALPNAQYHVAVFPKVRDATGRPLLARAAFLSFTVGASDDVAPFVVTTSPVNHDTRTTDSPGEVVIRFSEAVDGEALARDAVRARDVGAFVPGSARAPEVPPAPGYPRVRAGSGGHEVVWRVDPRAGGFASGTEVEVTVEGGAENPAAIRDVSGNPMAQSFRFTFRTPPPPDLPARAPAEEASREIEELRDALDELRERLDALKARLDAR